MGTRAGRAGRIGLPLLAWIALVALAVVQGRDLRDPDGTTTSWVLLVLFSLGAVVALYLALVQLLRERAAADDAAVGRTPPSRPTTTAGSPAPGRRLQQTAPPTTRSRPSTGRHRA